jgi:hypothetical protein
VSTADELTMAVARLVNQVSHWTPPRWAASSVSGPTKAEVVHALVQGVADLAADAEGEPRRPVPRLDSDLALPDQLRVVTADLAAAAPDEATAERAAALIAAARKAL